MSVERARIVKGAPADGAPSARPTPRADPPGGRGAAGAQALAARARRVAREIAEARAEAARIVDDAHARAAAVVESAAATAAREASEREVARLAAAFLALRTEEEGRAERELDRVVELATLLAERLVGEALRIEPTRIAELAASALEESRGARRVRVDASPDDVDALTAALGAIGHVAEVRADARLARGSLIVHTDLGRIDARLEPQLERLAAALREALR